MDVDASMTLTLTAYRYIPRVVLVSSRRIARQAPLHPLALSWCFKKPHAEAPRPSFYAGRLRPGIVAAQRWELTQTLESNRSRCGVRGVIPVLLDLSDTERVGGDGSCNRKSVGLRSTWNVDGMITYGDDGCLGTVPGCGCGSDEREMDRRCWHWHWHWR